MLKLPLSDAEPVSSSLPFTSQAARIKYGAPAAKTADAAFLRSTLNPSPPSFLACFFFFFFLFPFLFCLFQTCHLPLPSFSSDLFPSLYYLELCQVQNLPFCISISSLRPSLIRSDEAVWRNVIFTKYFRKTFRQMYLWPHQLQKTNDKKSNLCCMKKM